MPEITKETFLCASDPKNRDAMLYDMMKGINDKLNIMVQLKIDIAKCEKHLAYVKGIGLSVSLLFGGFISWLFKHS